MAGISGNVSNGLSGMAQNAGLAYLQGLGAQEVKALADQLAKDKQPTAESETVRAVLHAALACAGAAASGQSCGAGAMGAAGSVALNHALDKLQHTDAEKMTAEEKRQREKLIGDLLVGLAAGTGGADTAATVVNAAQTEVENNEFGKDELLKFQGLVAAQKICPDQKCRDGYAKEMNELIRNSSVAQVKSNVDVVVGEKDHASFYPEKSKLNPDYVSGNFSIPMVGSFGLSINLYNFNGYLSTSGGRSYPSPGTKPGFGIVFGNLLSEGNAVNVDNFLGDGGYSASVFLPVGGILGVGGGVNHSIGGDSAVEYGLATPGMGISPAGYSTKIFSGKDKK